MTRARDVATQGGLVLLNTTTLSSSSSVTISNVFTSTYDNYLIQVSNFTGTIGQVNLRLTSSGTPAITNDYRYSGNYSLFTSGSYSGQASNGTSGFPVVYINSSPPSAANITITNPAKTNNTCFLKYGTNFDALTEHNGVHILSTAYDGFTLFPESGTMTGTIKVYGYK